MSSLLAALALIVATFALPALAFGASPTYMIVKVADGDTVTLGNGQRIRLVQIHTPEGLPGAECYAAGKTVDFHGPALLLISVLRPDASPERHDLVKRIRSPHRQTVSAVNETPPSPKSPGRPRQDLTSPRKRVLERLAARVARCQDDLGSARVELAVAARQAYAEGASVRAIAEAVGLSRPRVHELLTETPAQ